MQRVIRFAFASLLATIFAIAAIGMELTDAQSEWIGKLEAATTSEEIVVLLQNVPSRVGHPVFDDIRNIYPTKSEAFALRERILASLDLEIDTNWVSADKESAAERASALASELVTPETEVRELRVGFDWLVDLIEAILFWLFGGWVEEPERSGSIPSMNWLQYLVWGVILLALAIGIVLLVRHVKINKETAARKRGLIEEHEEGMTSDDWLQKGDEHILAGRFRDAVRAFYLGCLIRLDEAGTLIFKKDETNWEHFRRYEKFSRQIENFDLYKATDMFDRTWYGLVEAAEQEALEVRTIYESLLINIKRKAS